MTYTNDNYVIKPPKIIYYTFYIFFGLFNALFLFVFLKNNNIWEPLVATAGSSLFIYYLIGQYRISISDGQCTISRPFTNNLAVRLEDILYINIVPAFESYGSKFKPPFRIAIGIRDARNEINEIILNAKMFDVENLDRFSDSVEKARKNPCQRE